MEESIGHRGVGGQQRRRRTRVVSRRWKVHAQRGTANWKLHWAPWRRRGPRGDVRRHHSQRGGADVEAERAEDLQQQAEERGVGGVGEDEYGLLLAAAGEALVLALAVEDEAVEESAAGGGRVGDAKGEERVVDGGAVAREVVGHGVREGGEGDEAVEAAARRRQRVGRVAGLHQLPALQVEPDDGEGPHPPRQRHGIGGRRRRRGVLVRPASQRDGRDPVHPRGLWGREKKLGIWRAAAPAELGLDSGGGRRGGRQRGGAGGGAGGVKGREAPAGSGGRVMSAGRAGGWCGVFSVVGGALAGWCVPAPCLMEWWVWALQPSGAGSACLPDGSTGAHS